MRLITDPAASGGGGSTNSASATVDFGTDGDLVSVVVAATWVTALSIITCAVVAHADHNIEEVSLEQISCYVGDIVVGVSFTAYIVAPNRSNGNYNLKFISVN
jgi:hypothetical protein